MAAPSLFSICSLVSLLIDVLVAFAVDNDALVRVVNNLTSCVVEHLLCWLFVVHFLDTSSNILEGCTRDVLELEVVEDHPVTT